MSAVKTNNTETKNVCGLSDDVILSILEDLQNKVSYLNIMKKYSISKYAINRIVTEYNMVRHNKTKITKEIVENVYEDNSNGKKINFISAKYGIGRSTAYRILKGEYDHLINEKTNLSDNKVTESNVAVSNINHADNKVTESNVAVSDINHADNGSDKFFNDNIEKYLKPIKNRPILSFGLVNERHDMPVSTYIFNKALSDELMFDYNTIDNICREFIKKHIAFDQDGNATMDINLYVTGCQCVLASFIKICEQMRVNLSLYHYCNRSGTYKKQTIFSTYQYPDEFIELLDNTENSFLYKCDLNTLIKNDKLYCIVVKLYNENGSTENHKNIAIMSNLNDAFEAYYFHIQLMQQINMDAIMYIYECRKSENKFIRSDNYIIKTSNF